MSGVDRGDPPKKRARCWQRGCDEKVRFKIEYAVGNGKGSWQTVENKLCLSHAREHWASEWSPKPAIEAFLKDGKGKVFI